MVNDLPNFDIVLVDIKKAAEAFRGQVVCVKKNLYDPTLRYVAISYRWGEVAEQVVDTSSDDDEGYLAHITSFSLPDFYELCQYMAEEVDLQHIDYVWVDAICVDQENKEHRKATIRFMSQIYEQATYILAVPDLHLAYLNLNAANVVATEMVRKHAVYIYHVIAQQDEGCSDIERIWCYNLLCDRSLTPSQFLIFYRHQLKSKLAALAQAQRLPPDGLACLHLLEPILSSTVPLSQHVQRHVEKYWFLNQTLNKSVVADIQQLEKKRTETPHRSWRLDTSSDHPAHRHRPRQLDMAWLTHPWHSHFDTILPQWNREYYATTKELRQAFDFLGYLVDEWSNRAWVISEYLIAKQKHARRHVPMKLIFLMLRPPFATTQRGATFFHVFDQQPSTQQAVNPWRSLGIQFRQQLTSRLSHRDFIEMIVDSKAKRAEDRFNSILPLWKKYKHVITTNDTVASWGITDNIMVVLKLYALMDDINDKLRLLHACAQWSAKGSYSPHELVFPTFATLLKSQFLKIIELERNTSPSLNIMSIDLMHTPRHRLCLTAKQYYKRIETENDAFFSQYYRSFGKKLQNAPLEVPEGQLVAIIIPLFCEDGSRIHLIGNEKSNRWILVRYINFYDWRELFTGPHPDFESCHIY